MEQSKQILLAILKSNLNIESAVFKKLEEMRKRYDTTWVSDNMIITHTKMSEIERQISILEK